MIRKECFTKEWIETVSNRFHYNDLNLIEKVIRAFSLVNMLSESGCPYIWKGGSCLMNDTIVPDITSTLGKLF